MTWNKRGSTISLKYRSQWGLWEAIREILQNCLDEVESLPDITVNDNGDLVIRDYGNGCSIRQFLVLGVSEKSSDDKRGKYGEGVKIALMIMKRLGYDVLIKSRDWICKLELEEFEGEPVITYYYKENGSPITGVEITISGLSKTQVTKLMTGKIVSDEINTIVNDPVYGKMMTNKEYINKIYNKRIFVSDAHKPTKYGYDFYHLTLNTDRNYADPWSLGFQLGNIIQSITDKETIKDILKRAWKRDTLESEAKNMNLNGCFYDAFKELYGNDAVISTVSDDRSQVNYRGGKLVVFQTDYIIRSLTDLGIETASQFLQRKSDEIRSKKKKSINEIGERKRLTVIRAFKLVDKIKMFNTTTEIALNNNMLEFYSKDKELTADGYHDNGKIGLAINILSDIPKVASTIAHELIHLEHGVGDCTPQFQSLMDQFNHKALKYLMNYLSLKSLDYTPQ